MPPDIKKHFLLLTKEKLYLLVLLLIPCLIGIILVFEFSFTTADEITARPEISQEVSGFLIIQKNSLLPISPPPVLSSESTNTAREITVIITGYSSSPEETDDSPFITASGSHVKDGIVAANFLPFNTIIKIPNLYGNKIFVVEDRMNPYAGYHVDIWFPSRQEALNFGVKTTIIELVS